MNIAVKICENNQEHVYRSEDAECPYCKIEELKSKLEKVTNAYQGSAG